MGPTADALDLVTYLTDAVDPHPERRDGLRAGHPVLLRPRADGGSGILEAWSPSLGRLGRLPREDGAVLASLLPRGPAAGAAGGGALLTGQVSALVPRPGGGARIHIRVNGRRPAGPPA